jgi:hypothetical protein
MLGEVFQRFVEKSPIAVMVRGLLERVLGAEHTPSGRAHRDGQSR